MTVMRTPGRGFGGGIQGEALLIPSLLSPGIKTLSDVNTSFQQGLTDPTEMPKSDYVLQGGFGSRGDGLYLKLEEAIGIAVLVIILVILLIIGCWYYKKRNGYLILQNRHVPDNAASSFMPSLHHNEEGTSLETKVPMNDYTHSNLIPNAPPAYDKIASEQMPPAYFP
ncbi:melanoma antigen recognized by T-cells 1 [Pristis pectinata]|uniref:melanoma antigen recognized by T-cells 1 n=1 Tax=Pristis pectinata TaxID=685728 RepID=UPI00223D4583|nr:melanoma antigen recognized by T-cells 1 [Pristis pectinata]